MRVKTIETYERCEAAGCFGYTHKCGHDGLGFHPSDVRCDRCGNDEPFAGSVCDDCAVPGLDYLDDSEA